MMRARLISTFALLCLTSLILISPEVVGEDSKPESESSDRWRVLPKGERPSDARLGTPRNLRDAYHPWVPPTTLEAWEQEQNAIRERILVSNGLWPMPPRPPIKATIHGKIDRGDYTIEKVFFASHPGHYVTGNLYRPKNLEGKLPGVLCPHGHWASGRFYDSNAQAAGQLSQEAESFLSGARYPLQARMVQLTRMGCVVFHYDMVGYADSRQVAHRQGFTDPEAALRLQNFMGLQTFNSIRALDFLTALPDVDASRIGVTGASGGGTQTFMLCAIDPRPVVAFPAVMVSTNMQGGCVCENAEHLRVGLNNIALAACFAPKPMAMSGADDWTIQIETKGLPELKQVYALYGKANLVHARCFPQFKHNYNEVSRELMFDWFNRFLALGHETPVEQADFWPVDPKELSVFNAEHPLPADAKTATELRDYLTNVSERDFQELIPHSSDEAKEYRQHIQAAARVMLDAGIPTSKDLELTADREPLDDSTEIHKGVAGRKGAGEQVPFIVLKPKNADGRVVLWADGAGKRCLFDENGKPTTAVRKLLDAGLTVASADLFLTGEYLAEGEMVDSQEVNESYQGFTFGYNRSVLSNRVRDLLTMCGVLQLQQKAKEIRLIGTGKAGPWILLANALAGDAVTQVVVDLDGFSFRDVTSVNDPMFLPGALKYGDIGGLAAAGNAGTLEIFGTTESSLAGLNALAAVNTFSDGTVSLSSGALTEEVAASRVLGTDKK